MADDCTRPVYARGLCDAHYRGIRSLLAESGGTIAWNQVVEHGFCLAACPTGVINIYKQRVRDAILPKSRRSRSKKTK